MSIQAEDQQTHYQLRFIVADSGVGLSAEEKSNLFQRFAQVSFYSSSCSFWWFLTSILNQASRSTFAEYGGSGLGLFICKNLARLMGGDILVESEKWKVLKPSLVHSQVTNNALKGCEICGTN